MKNRMTFIIGGARSGKSNYAVETAKATKLKIAYLATAQIKDAEMKARVKRHQKERPKGWQTIVVEAGLKRAIDSLDSEIEVIILDCLTVYISNQLTGKEEITQKEIIRLEKELLLSIEKDLTALEEFKGQKLIVSNEVGQGLVPPYLLGRLFRDIQGEVNKRVAEMSDEVVLMIAGYPLKIKEE